MLIIRKFTGRLGNHINQLKCIILMALLDNHQVAIKCKHKFFDFKIIIDYLKDRNKIHNSNVIIGGFFKRWRKQKGRLNSENKEIIDNLLKKAFKLKNIGKLDEDYIAVHIRSGDVFKSRPHKDHSPLPLSYFTYILNQKAYKKIILVSEDRRNPITNELLRLYDNAEHNINSLNKDLNILLGATNVIGVQGTFLNVLEFSDHLKNYFRPKMFRKELKDFFKINYPWRNTPKQIKNIFNYNFYTYMIGKKLEVIESILYTEQNKIAITPMLLEEIKQIEDTESEELLVTKKEQNLELELLSNEQIEFEKNEIDLGTPTAIEPTEQIEFEKSEIDLVTQTAIESIEQEIEEDEQLNYQFESKKED